MPITFRILTLLVLTPLSFASEDWQSTLTTQSPGPYLKKSMCRLDYAMSWKGAIKSGYCRVEFARNSGQTRPVKISSSGYTSGFVRTLFPYDFRIESLYTGRTLKPISFQMWERTRDEEKRLEGSFEGYTIQTEALTSPLDRSPSSRRSSTFSYPNVYDLLSSVLFIGSQLLNDGDSFNLVVHPFDRPYLAKVRVLKHEQHRGFPCIKIELQMSKIQNDLSLKNYDKMKKAVMWITDNEHRVMIELRSKVFIGDIRCTLIDYVQEPN